MPNIRWYDGFFLFMLTIGVIVVSVNWGKYSTCSYPLRFWIVVDYAAIFAFRMLMSIDDGLAVGLELHRNSFQRMIRFRGRLTVLACLALLLYPYLWAWTVVGSIWFTSAQNCVSEGQKWVFWVWLLFSYCGLICLACLSLGKWVKHRRTYIQRASRGSAVSEWEVLVDFIEAPFQTFEGVELEQDTRGVTLEAATYHPGLFLTHSQREAVDGLIQQLPKFCLKVVPTDCSECPICLEEFHAGNEVRGLPCAHNFHVACIDEWLRLNIKCPRCRCSVFPNLDLSALSSGSSQRSRGLASIYFGGDAAARTSGSSQSTAVTARYVRAPAGESNLLRLQEILRTMRLENASQNEIHGGQVVEGFVRDGSDRPSSNSADTIVRSGSDKVSDFPLSDTMMVERSPPARF